MKDIYELGRNLTNCLVGEQHSVTVNTLDRCSCKGLIEDSLYLFIPHIGAEHYDSKAQKSKQNRIKESQKIVKQQILKYAKTNNLEIAVSKTADAAPWNAQDTIWTHSKEKQMMNMSSSKNFLKTLMEHMYTS